jgi:hypothetical protein
MYYVGIAQACKCHEVHTLLITILRFRQYANVQFKDHMTWCQLLNLNFSLVLAWFKIEPPWHALHFASLHFF